jgi:addiction module HigA family antidote
MIRHPMKNPPHIGSFLRTEVIEEAGLTVIAAAEALGVTRQALDNLLDEKSALSAEMALRFEKAFGVGMEHLLRMQLVYETARVRARADSIVVTPPSRQGPGEPR